MKVFWQLSLLIISHILPQKTWERIERIGSPYREIIKTMFFIISSVIAIALIYFLIVLPLKALGIHIYVK